jgi:hypothetical protein
MNEIKVYSQAGVIDFGNYHQLLNQAVELAEHIANVEVTEETVKTTKKLLASVNKRVNELEDSRKAVKKQLLEPYEAFEKQVKEIVNVVKEADAMVRQQVKQLEEKEREAKKEKIAELFYKRLNLYPSLQMFAHVDFIENKHLNKTMSLNKVEEELAEWFFQTNQAVALIKDLDDSDEILVEYIKCKNPITAMQIVKERKQMQNEISERKEVKKANTVVIEFDEQFLPQVHVFLKMSGISYIKK